MIRSLNQLPNNTFKLESQIYLLENLVWQVLLYIMNGYLKYQIYTNSLI